MNARTIALAVVISVLSVMALTCVSDMADADPVADAEYYCYGDNPTFTYDRVLTEDMTITWIATGMQGDGSSVEINKWTGVGSITIDISGYESVTVTQDVEMDGQSDSRTVVVHPIHVLDAGEGFDVVFMDGSSRFDTQHIDNTKVVEVGDDHVIIPAEPVKDGYEFDGWYTDTSFTNQFNPKLPIYNDDGETLYLYAKWVSTSDVPGTSVGSGGYVVTFETDPGLEYTVLSNDSGTVVFYVGVVGGFQLSGDVTVTSDSGTIGGGDGVYTLSDIEGDTVVTISGDTRVIGGGTTVVHVDRINLVTFDTVTGLEYTITSVGGTTVTFHVDVANGFRLEGDPEVSSNRGSLTFEDGTYTLSNIGTNTVVTIDGDVRSITEPAPSDEGSDFPWWLIVIVVIVIAAIAVYLAYRRGRNSS